MCRSCLPYRDASLTATHSALSHEDPARGHDLSGLFQTPLTRAQLLQGGIGGVGLALATSALGLGLSKAIAAPLPYVVLIVLDGARPDYFRVAGIPHVRNLMRNGTHYTNAFAGILESETPSGHATISTGSEPRVTGIPSFWWANSDNLQVNLFNPTKIRAGDMEKIIRESGVPTLAGLVHGKNPRAAVVSLSGSKYYAADALGGPDADVIMYFNSTPTGQFVPTYIPGHAPPLGLLTSSGATMKNGVLPLGLENHLAMKLAMDTFQRMRQRVTLINLPEFDWPLGHVDGGILDPKGVRTLMQGFDSDLAMLQDAYRRAGVLDRTIFVLTADHGMMPLVHKVPKSDITGAVARAGTAIVSEAYTSAAYLWLKDAARIKAAGHYVANLHNPLIQSVYIRTHTSKGFIYQRVTSSKLLRGMASETANQYLLHSFNGSNAPDMVVLFTEGVGSEPGGQANWKADHGGSSWEAQHIPLVISGPGVRSGQVSSHPARLIDIAPTVLRLMNIPHKTMQGIPLADAIKASPGTISQRSTGRRLLPVISGLQSQSRQELAAGR